MQLLLPGRVLRCGTVLALLSGCAEDIPQAPTTSATPAQGSPSFAIGLYGVAGAPITANGRPCTRSEYRQFDFWLGSWEVQLPDGTPAGTNIISSALDGCAVLESYADQGYIGRSLNSYDAATNQWHQHWSDNQTTVLSLFGSSPQSGTMILAGVRPLPSGASLLDRITWTEESPDLVRQLWEVSSDGGQTFPQVQFDGRYHRRSSVTPDPEIPTSFCSDAAFPALFQFDFTLGLWKVDVGGQSGGAGQPELRSTIAKDIDDCLIEERLKGRAGYEAIIFTAVRRRLGEWVKTLVDNRGTNVFLKGRLTGGQMVLTGTVPSIDGVSKDVRVTWVEGGPDNFQQRWETTSDGGATWQQLLVAEYSRR
jgi:hypothetical protein